MNHTRHWLLYSGLVSLILLLFACGREEPVPDPASLPNTELVLITDSHNSELDKELYRRFEERHPNLEVSPKTWSAWPRQYLTSDEPPALMLLGAGDWIFSTMQEGLVADVTDVWQQSNLAENYPANLEDLTIYGGKQYMLPAGYDWRAIYYNRAIFDQYGLSEPETWDELIQIAETLVLNGEIPFSLAGRDEWQASLWFDYLNMRLHGPEFHVSLINGEISYADDRLRDTFGTWQFLFDQGYFLSQPGNLSDLTSLMSIVRNDAKDPLTREKAVMLLTSSGSLVDLPAMFRAELDFFRFPDINPAIQRGEILGAFGFIIPAKTAHRLEATQFLAFVADPEIQNLITQSVGAEDSFVPAHIRAASGDLDRDIQKGLNIIQSAELATLPYFWASPGEMRIKMDSAIGRFLRSISRSEVDLDPLLTSLEEERLKVLGQGGFSRN